jgi:hypothetical protein
LEASLAVARGAPSGLRRQGRKLDEHGRAARAPERDARVCHVEVVEAGAAEAVLGQEGAEGGVGVLQRHRGGGSMPLAGPWG